MPQALQGRVRFGPFELDPRAGELHKNGHATVLQEQQLKLLLMLIERKGEIATREEIRQRLWPNDTVVEFDHGINNTIKNLRRALGDSAENPNYIETLARRGYRLMVAVEWGGVEFAAADSGKESSPDSSSNESALPDSGDRAESESEGVPKAKLRVGGLTGKVVSHYRVLEVIGGGGMGLVYRAEDLKLGRAVALKFLPEEVGDDPKARERFNREAHAVSALDHPNICTVYDFDEHEGHPFIAMQLLQGKTLRDYLADARFQLVEPEGLAIAIQIALGLEAAHEKGIIHRDIKPANIFITEKNVAKILDFGVAKVMQLGIVPETPDPGKGSRNGATEEIAPAFSPALTNADGDDGVPGGGPLQSQNNITRTGLSLGTAGYMSPEQIRGELLDTRTDIFSFGLVLYEMATGERAFTGETEAAVNDAIQHREPKSVRESAPEISPGLELIIGKCLEKGRQRRYKTAIEARNSLEQVQKETTTAEEIKLQRKRWKYVAAVAAVIAILAGGLYYRVQRSTHKLTDKDTIVLADFENHTGDPVLGDAMDAALTVELQQSPFLNLLAPDKVRDALKQMNRPDTEKMTSEVALEVCRRTKSAALVTGLIADEGNLYKIALKATDCQSSKEWSKAEVESADRGHIVHALGEAGYQLRGRLGEPKASLQDFNQPLDVATSASPEALQAASLGSRAELRDNSGGSYVDRAVDIDPQFALAYAWLGLMQWNHGEITLAIDSFKKAFGLRDRATRRDRLYIEGHYYNDVTGEGEKSIDVWRQLADAYPRDPIAHNNLSQNLRLVGKYQEAIAEARESLRIDPDNYRPVLAIAGSEMALERPEVAKAAYEQARNRGLDSAYLRWMGYRVAFVQKDTALMQQQVAWALQSGRGEIVLFDHSNTLRYYGRVAKAREVALKAVQVAQGDNAPELAASWIVDEALADAEIGEQERAKALLRKVSGLDEKDPAKILAVARCGHLDEAEQAMEKLREQFPLNTSLRYIPFPSIRAAIALGGHNPSEAINQLQPADRHELVASDLPPLYPAYLRGLAYLQLGEPRQAAAEFQKLIDHPGIVQNSVFGALAHLQIGRAQAMAGDKVAARKSYQEFLTLWKDADPDIPIYVEAKAEYAKLQ